MRCAKKGCKGQLEARCTLYLDVLDVDVVDQDDGMILLKDIAFSRLNDQLDGHWINVEDMVLSCDRCGREHDYRIAESVMARVGLQPIGDAPRTLGTRGGLQ
jgi:hypothetical protein